MRKRVLITGAKGFIAGYLIDYLLCRGYSVIGIDDYSKYGYIKKSYDDDIDFEFHEMDVRKSYWHHLLHGCDHLIAIAAQVGGISYFNAYAYDLLRNNELIIASTFDAALKVFGKRNEPLKKITVISSSMVFENATEFPTPEGHQLQCPPPSSTYGFQKLATEYFAYGALRQYGLPYTIIRPFNCIGLGEYKALGSKKIKSGNIELAMSHVVPDLVKKIVSKQRPLHIFGNGDQIRHYTYGGDIARGIAMSLDNEKTINDDFNISTQEQTTVKQLANFISYKIDRDYFPNGDQYFIYDEPFPYDVQKRIPYTGKAKKILGFEATVPLYEALDEIIPWIKSMMDEGKI